MLVAQAYIAWESYVLGELFFRVFGWYITGSDVVERFFFFFFYVHRL